MSDIGTLPKPTLCYASHNVCNALELALVNLRVGNYLTAGRMIQCARDSARQIQDDHVRSQAYTLTECILMACHELGVR